MVPYGVAQRVEAGAGVVRVTEHARGAEPGDHLKSVRYIRGRSVSSVPGYRGREVTGVPGYRGQGVTGVPGYRGLCVPQV